MAVLGKGTDFGATEQITSTKLDNLVDAAKFVNSSGSAVTPSGTGTCTSGGGLEISSATGQIGISDSGVTTAKINDDAVTSDKLADATLTFIKSALYPVGYVLTTIHNYADSAAVVTAFGGTTWVRFGAGKALVGYDASDTDFDAAEETGGVKSVTLTAAQSGLPSHSHTQLGGGFDGSVGIEAGNQRGVDLGQTGTTGGTDASSAHTNLQPYITIFMWKRTA
jgi:microcystin-dependent protein